MAQNIKTSNTTITFDNIENLSGKKAYVSNGKSFFTDADFITQDQKLDIPTLVEVNTTSNNLEDNLPFSSLLLNWSGAKIEFNGTTYTINTTPELLEALIDAGQVSSILNDSNLPIRTSVVTEEFSYLGEAIGELAQIASEKMADWE